MVGRGPPLHGRLFHGRIDGSNPSSSTGESGELPYCSVGSFRSRTPSSFGLEWPIVKNGGSRRCLYLDVR
jgi:hypothetical protein